MAVCQNYFYGIELRSLHLFYLNDIELYPGALRIDGLNFECASSPCLSDLPNKEDGEGGSFRIWVQSMADV